MLERMGLEVKVVIDSKSATEVYGKQRDDSDYQI